MKYAIKTVCFITLMMTVFIFSASCSDDTNEEIIVEFETFLEKNDKTAWLLSTDDRTVYIRLNNDTILLIEQWRYNSDLDCYAYNPNIFNPGTYKVKENSNHKLVIDCDIILGDCDCMTFSRHEDTLHVDIRISEWEEETVYFSKASVLVDDLVKCAIEDDNDGLKFYHATIP